MVEGDFFNVFVIGDLVEFNFGNGVGVVFDVVEFV